MKHAIISFVIWLLSCVQLFSQDTLRMDLSEMWFYYDETGEKHLIEKDRIGKTIHLLIDFDEYKNGIIRIVVPKNTSFFVNSKINNVFLKKGKFDFTVTKEDNMISLYHPKGIAEFKSELIFPNIPISNSSLSIEIREKDIFSNFIMIALLLLFIFYGFIKIRNYELFNNYFKLSRAIAFRSISETLFKIRILEKNNMLLILAHSFGMGLAIVGIINWSNLSNQFGRWLEFSSIWEAILNWVVLSFLIWGALLLKSVLITAFSIMFKIKQFRRIHYYTHLRLTIFIYAFWLVLLTFFVYQMPETNASTLLINIGLTLMFIRIAIIFIKLLNYEAHRFLYLFSYICATEILPYLYMVKITYL
ncbi:MAG: DUF4271 domain-containing protein [Cyclobacteriaceae bacterium]|nr:DUF4271 domain-containing protein [Cyclobacteriaceae bacterium]